MNLTKENVKKICGIILFTVVVLVIVQNYEKVGNAIGLLWGIIFPFVLGGIIGHGKRLSEIKNPLAEKENSSAGGSENRRRISPRRPLLPAVRRCGTRSARRRCPPASPAASESSGSFLRQAAQPCSAESCPLQRSGR